MNIDLLTRNKIIEYLKSGAIGDLNYKELLSIVNSNNKNKYCDKDLLAFFVNTIDNILNNKVKSINMLEKYMNFSLLFYAACIDKHISVDFGIIVKMQMIKENYSKFCEVNNFESDENVRSLIDKINILLSSQYKENTNKDYSLYVLKIKDLEKDISVLKKQIAEKDNDLVCKKDEITKLLKDIKAKDSYIQSLKEEYMQKEEKYSEMNHILEELEALKHKLSYLNTYLDCSSKEIESLKSEKLELDKKIGKQDATITKFNEEQSILEKQKFLDNIVLNFILKDSMTLKKLYLKVRNLGYKFEENEIYESIIRIGQKFNIVDDSAILVPPKYGIMAPKVDTRKDLVLSSSPNSCKDILLISDLHLEDVDNKTIKVMNEVYNYCVKYNISTILNLGDFLDSDNSFVLDRNTLNDKLRLLDNIINKFPSSPEISHLILGGNHDEDYLMFGIDPIKYISAARTDFICLGYNDAFLYFGTNEINKDFIGLHHKGLPSEHDYDFLENGLNIEQKINEFYGTSGKKRNHSFIDIYGHRHRSRLDSSLGYCYVPSLTRKNNGAWHLKIYFDENRNIKYIIFIPLVYSNKFLPATEQVYQKIKKK